MVKKKTFIYLILLIFFLVFLLFLPSKKEEEKKEAIPIREKRAIFISYIELGKLKGKDEASGKNIIDDMLDTSCDFGFNMILLQIRSFSDSIYTSDLFPSSRVVVDNEGDPLPFDLLEYFIVESHKRGMELHAWINPYRIRSSLSKDEISDKNPAFLWLETTRVEQSAKGLFYNPADPKVEELILTGVKEILANYDVDGIHYDDYFYPTDTIDKEEYQKARAENASLTLLDFRLSVTSRLIKKTYQAVKKKDKRILFGISPEGNIDNNYTSNYIDTRRFAKEAGFVDYLMPQIYFGFLNGSRPFYQTVKEWNQMIETDVMLIPALAFYKVGQVDTYAKGGSSEWLEYNNIIAREVLSSRPLSNYQGFSIFRYDSLFSKNLTEQAIFERENLKTVLESDKP